MDPGLDFNTRLNADKQRSKRSIKIIICSFSLCDRKYLLYQLHPKNFA